MPNGEYVSAADGSGLSDDLFGTTDTPPDPLAATGGSRFEHMSVGEVREHMLSGGASALACSLGGGEYGAYWGSYSGE